MDRYVDWGWAFLIMGCIKVALEVRWLRRARPEGDRFQRRLQVAESLFRGAFGCLAIGFGVLLLLPLHVSHAAMVALESVAGIVLIVIGCGLAVWARIFVRYMARDMARDGYHGPLRWPMMATATLTFAGLALVSVCGGVLIVVPPSPTAMLGTAWVVWVVGAGVVSSTVGVLGFVVTTLLAYHHK